MPSPPLAHFLADGSPERSWAQLHVRRSNGGFELRHVDDQHADPARLRRVTVDQLRDLASRNGSGAFRPLRAAPDLVSGWRCVAAGEEALEQALSHLYPGTLADACALAEGRAQPVTWEAFAGRQLGRAKALRELADQRLAETAAAGCHPSVCLKRRLWTAPGLPPDPEGGKSSLPCLEPCAVFVGFARACLVAMNAPTVPVHFAPDDLATLAAALRHALEHPPSEVRDGPLDPRRLRRVLTVHQETWHRALASPSRSASDE